MAKIVSFFSKFVDVLTEAREMQIAMKAKYPHL